MLSIRSMSYFRGFLLKMILFIFNQQKVHHFTEQTKKFKIHTYENLRVVVIAYSLEFLNSIIIFLKLFPQKFCMS